MPYLRRLFAASLFFSVGVGCGSSTGGGGFADGGPDAASGGFGFGGKSGSGGAFGGSGGFGNNPGGGGVSASGGVSGSGGVGASGGVSGTGAGGSGGTCVTTNAAVQPIAFDAYLLLDQSGSMADPAKEGGTKWAAVELAVSQFITSPEASGEGLGLQYVPLMGGACPSSCVSDVDCGSCGPCFANFCLGSGQGSCTASDYATPAIEIAPLPGNASSIQNSVVTHAPTGSSVMSASLQGGVDHAKAWAGAHSDHAVAVILTSDSDPNVCDTNYANIAAIANAGASTAPKVSTYVIGMGGTGASFDSIAAAGGTQKAFMIDTATNLQIAFVDAMKQIRLQNACAFSLPPVVQDPSKVNFDYTPPGGSPEVVPNAGAAGGCPASGLAWYYDNASAPTRIELCPATCSSVMAQSGASFAVAYGCPTQLL